MKDEIIKKEEELRLAMLAGDVQKLDELIDDNLTFISPFGCMVTKQMDLNVHRTKAQVLTSLEPTEQTIDVRNNIVIVTVKMQLTGTYNKMDVSGKYRYMRIWQKIEDKWKIVAGSVLNVVYD